MRFIKKNSYDIIKLYINQIGIAIFSLVLYTAIGMIDSETLPMPLKIGVSVFAILFYFVLIYTVTWEIGAKDKIRVDAGKEKCVMSKGFLMGLFANLPNFIFTFICILGQGVYMLTEIEAFKTLGAVFNLIIRLFLSMYLGVIQGIFSPFAENVDLYFLLQSCGFFLLPLLAVFTTDIGYRMGMKNIKFFSSKTQKNK